jgi:dienelactone hydrolase
LCFAETTQHTIDLTAADGTMLKATYFGAGKKGPGVLLLHQCNRQRKVWDGLAQQLAAAGINVLTLDLRGFGESGGDRVDTLTPQAAAKQEGKWPADIDVAFQYLTSRPGVTRDVIGVGGASCGVDNAVQTARRHSEVKSLVLLSGSTNLAGRQFLRNDNSIPIFFAFADDDEFKPSIVAIQFLYSITADPSKKMVSYPTGGHGADIFTVHPDLPKQIVDWLVTTLITTPGQAPAPKEAAAVPEEMRILNLLDEPGGPKKVEELLTEARQRNPKAQLFPESIVNIMGYDHMQAGDMEGAIEILKLNAMAYPNSPNVYDSLGDVYLANGQKKLARENALKTLELLPSDTADDAQRREGIKNNAEQKLKQLGDAPK